MENTLLVLGLLLVTGLLLGWGAQHLKLPKVSGYIIAGLLLNPGIIPLLPASFVTHTEPISHIAMAFITFAVGGSLAISRIRKLGRSLVAITLCEAAGAIVMVSIGMALLLNHALESAFAAGAVPLGLLLASLAVPTDPSATLAVSHEYRAQGPLMTTIMGVAALDDAVGLLTFSLCLALAHTVLGSGTMDGGWLLSLGTSLAKLAAAIGTGCLGGMILTWLTAKFPRSGEGTLIIKVLALLSLAYGISHAGGWDGLLATMVMGIYVVNRHPRPQPVFQILERYTEELIFLLFFTLSGLQLDINHLGTSLILIPGFVVLRTAGKFIGTYSGGFIGKAQPTVRHFAAFGLLPQGGIVIGLALMLKSDAALAPLANPLIGTIIGATLLHEIVGPLLAKYALTKAGEIPSA